MWKQLAILNAVFHASASLALRKYEIMDKDITGFQIYFTIISIGFAVTLIIAASFKKYRDEVKQLYTKQLYTKQLYAKQLYAKQLYPKLTKANKPTFIFWIVLASIFFVVGDLFFFKSHIKTPHITLLLVVGTLVAAAIEIMGSYLFFNEKLKTRSIIGILIMFSGATLL